MSDKKVTFSLLFAVIVLFLGAILFITVRANSPEGKLLRQLELGNKYLSEEDFERAIIAFDEAISIDPKCVEAYLGKAKGCEALGDIEDAIETLTGGYKKTENKKLKKELESVVEDKVEELVDKGKEDKAIKLMLDVQDDIDEDVFIDLIESLQENEGEDSANEVIIGNEENIVLQAYYELLSMKPAAEISDDDYYDASYGVDDNIAKYGEHIEYASVRDINKDGVPELLCMTLYNFRWEYITIYSYIDEQVILVGELDECHTAAGWHNAYFCEDGHIHNAWVGTDPMGNDASYEEVYLFDGRGLALTDCFKGETGNAEDSLYQMNWNDDVYRQSLLN